MCTPFISFVFIVALVIAVHKARASLTKSVTAIYPFMVRQTSDRTKIV